MLQRNLIRYSVLLLSIAALLIPAARIEYDILKSTHGVLIFPLDAAYTNMTVAKNLAFHTVWGMSKYAFSQASSSPLYVVMLAIVFFIMGAHPVIVLLINTAAAIAFLVVFQHWLIRQGLKPIYQFLIMLMVIYRIPIPLLMISGMEYTVELLLAFLFVISFLPFSRLSLPISQLPRKVYIYGLLMVTTNYETIILVAIVCIILLLRRQWWLAFKTGGVSILPVVLFGVLAVSNGCHFIPPPVLHPSGWSRRIKSDNIRQACIRSYNEEYQLARFVRSFYYKRHVAACEMGAVSYYSEGRKMDLSKMDNKSSKYIDSVCREDNVQLAILYDQSFRPDLLSRWIKVASWQIPDKIAPREDSAFFYTPNLSDTAMLRQSLIEFQPRLPSDVVVQYY